MFKQNIETLVCFIRIGTQHRTLIDIKHPLSNYDYLIFSDKDIAKERRFYLWVTRDYFLFDPTAG